MTQTILNLRARLRACRGVLVDSNVLLDIATNDPAWGDWSAHSVAVRGRIQGRLWEIKDIVAMVEAYGKKAN